MNKFIYLTFFLLLFAGCYRVSDTIHPNIEFAVEKDYIQSLNACFPPLSKEEQKQDFGKEYIIGISFAHQLDLYRAISTFKRAEILTPYDRINRKQEIQYYILYCYYLGKKYRDVIETFEQSELPHVDKTFCVFHDMLVILYESYQKLSFHEKAENILEVIEQFYPGTAKKLTIASDLYEGNLDHLEKIQSDPIAKDYLPQMLNRYHLEKKSISKAQVLNALLPGAGYLYLGQKKSALTSLLINGLFIAAAYQFFHHNHIAAGIITTSFEAGWYFGGIYGAGESAKFYNERLYQQNAIDVMEGQRLFPVFMLQYGF